MQVYSLKINKNNCFGCNICTVSCPINFQQLKEKGSLTEKNAVILVKNGVAYNIFDDNRKFNCDGCGVCQKVCPSSSIEIELLIID